MNNKEAWLKLLSTNDRALAAVICLAERFVDMDSLIKGEDYINKKVDWLKEEASEELINVVTNHKTTRVDIKAIYDCYTHNQINRLREKKTTSLILPLANKTTLNIGDVIKLENHTITFASCNKSNHVFIRVKDINYKSGDMILFNVMNQLVEMPMDLKYSTLNEKYQFCCIDVEVIDFEE